MTSAQPRICACIFDMDGLLLNTEDQITTCINRILSRYSKPPLPWSLKAKVQGRSAVEANAIFHGWAQLPVSPEEYSRQLGVLHQELFPNSQPLPGVKVLLESLSQARTNDGTVVELALGTSSVTEKFELKTRNQKVLFNAFPAECIVLGDDRRVKRHKPAPDVYLCALQCVNQKVEARGATKTIEAKECLVFEDAILGVDAGLAAGMQVVWCPHPELLREICNGEENDIREEVARVFRLKDSRAIKGMSVEELAQAILEGTEVRARLLTTLEHFPYRLYGIEIDGNGANAQL